MHECKETEKGTGSLYSDSHCTTLDSHGTFRTVPLPKDQWSPIYPTWTGDWFISSPSLGIKVRCTGLGGGGTFKNIEVVGEQKVEGKEVVFELSGCTVVEPVGCSVPSTLKFEQLNAISEVAGEVDKIKFTPATGETIATIKLSGCAAAGSYKLKGTATARVQAASRPSLEFSSTSSSLTLGANSATLTGLFHWATFSDGVTIGFER